MRIAPASAPTTRATPLSMSIVTMMMVAGLLAVGLTSGSISARAQKKDYLTQMEADKIRDADTPSDRVKLLLSFASDRIKKLNMKWRIPAIACIAPTG